MTLAQRGLALALLVLAAIGYGHLRYTAGYDDGSNAVVAKQAAADNQSADDAQHGVTASAQTGNALTLQINTTLPAIEVASNDTAQRIRTIYLAAPVAAGGSPQCARPDGVQQQLDAAVAAANAAAAGHLRPNPTRPPPAAPAAPTRPR